MKVLILPTARLLMLLTASLMFISSCTKKDQPEVPATTQIATMTPTHGERASIVTLTGTNMDLDAEVYMGNIKITGFQPGRTTSQIQFIVPATAVEEKVTLRQRGTTYDFGTYKVTNIWLERNNGTGFGYEFYEKGVAFAINGKIYTGFGYHSSTTTFKVYDIATATWSSLAYPFPVTEGRVGATVVVINDKAYIGFGRLFSGSFPYLNDWWEFDPSKTGNPWQAKKPIPAPYKYYPISFVVNNEAYIGLGGDAETADFKGYKYNPVTDTWTLAFNEGGTFPKLNSASAFVLNGQVYFGGGVLVDNVNSTTQNNWFQLNGLGAASSNYTPIASNSPTVGASSFVLANKAYVLEDNLFYQYVSNSWNMPSFPPQRLEYTVTSNNRIFAFSRSGEVYEYIPNY